MAATKTRGWAAAFALMAILNVVLYWVFIPYRSQQRFMLQALGMAAVPLALLLDRWRWLCACWLQFLLGLHLLTPECWPFVGRDGSIPWDLSAAVPNAIGASIPLFSRIENVLRENASIELRSSVWRRCGCILVASIFVSWAWCRDFAWQGADRPARGDRTRGHRGLSRLGLHGRLAGTERRSDSCRIRRSRTSTWAGSDWRPASGPRGSRVAYAGTNIPYYLFGKDLRNEVRYVNIDRNRDWLLHDYHRRALGGPRGNVAQPEAGLGSE